MVRVKVKIHGEDHATLTLEEGRRYLFGRRKDCDFVLKNFAGLSRAHFCLDLASKPYRLEVLENARPFMLGDSEITNREVTEALALELDPYTFIFEPNDSPVSQATFVAQPEMKHHLEDITQVQSEVKLTPYVLLKSDPSERSIKLLGAHWIAGRDESCDIVIQHPRASRQQFEIFHKDDRFFIRDLNSSHGTHVMGQKVSNITAQELKSGDVIDVEGFNIIFELRDPTFDKRPSTGSVFPVLKNILPEKWIPHSTPEESVVVMEAPTGGLSRRKKMYIGAAVAIAAIIYLGSGDTSKKDQVRTPSAEQKVEDAFAKLNPAQQDIVRHSFKLADNLIKQQKFELALEQLATVHTYVPQYENSRELEGVALQYRQIRDQQNYLERQRRQLAAVNQKVQEILASCESVAARATTLAEIETCLQPALELNPTHPDHARLIGIVQERIQQKEEAARERSRHQARVAQGVQLYEAAVALEEKGKILEAIKAYERHIASSLPDPQGLKEKSRKQSMDLEQSLRSRREAFMEEARNLASSGDLGGGIQSARKAAELAPNDADIAQFIDDKTVELNKKLKALYTESVLEERFGNIDAAKGKWESILKMDLPGGEYSSRARNKLKQYGDK